MKILMWFVMSASEKGRECEGLSKTICTTIRKKISKNVHKNILHKMSKNVSIKRFEVVVWGWG